MITTENMNIDPELCKRLDKEIYSSKNDRSPVAIKKANCIRTELINLLEKYDQSLSDFERKYSKGLYHIYTVIERVQNDYSKHDSEKKCKYRNCSYSIEALEIERI